MNQTFDMRLDIKPPAQRPNKPAVNKAETSASDSSFQKTLKDATSSKQPVNKVEAGKPVGGKTEGRLDADMIPQEDTVDLQNAAAMMAATMMPVIVMPEQMQVQPEPETQVSQVLTVDVSAVTSDMTQQGTVQQPVELQQMEQAAPEQQIKPIEVHTMEQQAVTAEPQANAAQKITEPQTAVVEDGQDKTPAVVTEAGAAAQPARPLFEQVEATPIKVAEPVQADTPEFPVQLAKQINTAAVEGANTIEVQLTPYELGKITIRLTMTEDGMQISMHSANSKTVRLLAEHAANIGALVEQNQSGTVSVSVEHEQPNAQQNQYAQQERQGNGQQQQQQGNRHAQAQNDDFIQQLRLGLAGLA